MTATADVRTHKRRVLRAIFHEISVKAKKQTAYPNKSKSGIGKILIGCCNCKRVWSIQTKKYAMRM